MTAALEGGEWSAARHGRTLPPGKTRYPLYRRLGGPQGWSGRAENLVPTEIRSRTVQPIVSRYTDWATLPTSTPTYFDISVSSSGCSTFVHCWVTWILKLQLLKLQFHKIYKILKYYRVLFTIKFVRRYSCLSKQCVLLAAYTISC